MDTDIMMGIIVRQYGYGYGGIIVGVVNKSTDEQVRHCLVMVEREAKA